MNFKKSTPRMLNRSLMIIIDSFEKHGSVSKVDFDIKKQRFDPGFSKTSTITKPCPYN